MTEKPHEAGEAGEAGPWLSLAEVEAIARNAHAQQVDKAGRPYVEHLEAVASRTASYGGDDAQVAAGWLHDAIEDDALTLNWLASAALPQRTKDIVVAMTKRTGEPLQDYAARILATPGAVTVKDADLSSNSAPDRLALLPDAALRARLTAKYDLTRRLIHPDSDRRPALGTGADGDPDDATLLAGLDRESEPARQAWRALAEYATGWAVEPGDVEWTGGCATYGARVDALTQALVAVGAVTPAYAWTSFTEPDLAPGGTFTPGDAVRAATAIVRGERFCEGSIGTAWKSGRLFAVVRALSAVSPESPPSADADADADAGGDGPRP
ncbi:hypothetical protein ABH940_006797 [Streptacidiphilus sp. BW17]